MLHANMGQQACPSTWSLGDPDRQKVAQEPNSEVPLVTSSQSALAKTSNMALPETGKRSLLCVEEGERTAQCWAIFAIGE